MTWLPYPENRPQSKHEDYLVTLEGMVTIMKWKAFDEEEKDWGWHVYGNHISAFMELPKPYEVK